jgi:thiamine-phosphate pyrophosphorylase
MGASYAGIGPIFETRTKRVTVGPLESERLAEIVSASPLPLVAIAGIGLSNIEAVARTGVHAAAVVSDLLLAPDVEQRARALLEAFQRGAGARSVPGL